MARQSETFWWTIAPSSLVRNHYCPLDGSSLDVPADQPTGILEVALFNGRDHRRVCDVCLTRHAPRLRAIASRANGVIRSTAPTLSELMEKMDAEPEGFEIVVMERVVPRPCEDMPLDELPGEEMEIEETPVEAV